MAGTTYDNNSNLLNRFSFMSFLDKEYKSSSTNFCILVVELASLSQLVDSIKDEVLSQVLNQIVFRIESQIQGSDIFARLDDSRFGVLLRDIDYELDATQVAWKLYESLKVSVLADGKEHFMQPQVAIVNSISANSGKELLKNASLTLAQIGSTSNLPLLVYDRSIRSKAELKVKIASSLPQAIAQEEFEVYYQPIVCLQTGDLYGFEALVRWHKGDTIISPTQFIPICEETGLIIPLGLKCKLPANRYVCGSSSTNDRISRLASIFLPSSFMLLICMKTSKQY